MKIDPVYLLAPEPDTRVKLSRRALLGALAASGAVCGFGGIGIGWRMGGGEVAPSSSDSVARERGAKRLAWAGSVARGTIDDLLANAHGFLLVVSTAPDAEELWAGVARLADHIIEDHARMMSGRVRQQPVEDPTIAVLLLHLLDRVQPAADHRRFDQRRSALANIVQ